MAIPKAANGLHNTFTNNNNEGLPSTIIFSHNNQRSLPQPSEFVTFGQVAISPPWRRGFSQRGVTGCGASIVCKEEKARAREPWSPRPAKKSKHTHTMAGSSEFDQSLEQFFSLLRSDKPLDRKRGFSEFNDFVSNADNERYLTAINQTRECPKSSRFGTILSVVKTMLRKDMELAVSKSKPLSGERVGIIVRILRLVGTFWLKNSKLLLF